MRFQEVFNPTREQIEKRREHLKVLLSELAFKKSCNACIHSHYVYVNRTEQPLICDKTGDDVYLKEGMDCFERMKIEELP